MPIAARLTDFHECPMSTPTLVPHVGGPVVGPGAPSVLIGRLPSAKIGDMLICDTAPESIFNPSNTATMNNIPAARLGDSTAHGGALSLGDFSVQIGA